MRWALRALIKKSGATPDERSRIISRFLIMNVDKFM